MSYSMTGLGAGESSENEITVSTEIKSVNNRFLDVSIRMPSDLSTFERDVRDLVKSRVKRGKVYVNVSVQKESQDAIDFQINHEKLKAVHQLLTQISSETGINESPGYNEYLHFSEIFEPLKNEDQEELLWRLCQRSLNQAMTNFLQMREDEGQSLVKDIRQRIQKLDEMVHKIDKIITQQIPQAQQKMIEKLSQLAGDVDISQERLVTEFALMASKMDITEECVRLQSHLQLFESTLKKNEDVGKKLNFLLQEMNRESNTISSKASNAEVSHLIVEMKNEIEKMREQVQNLE